MYSLSSVNDSIYIDDKGNEVIVTDNLQYYVDKTSFSHITISPRVATWEARNSFGNILNKLAESNKQSVKNLLEWVGFTELMEKSKEGASEDLGQLVERIQKNIQVSYANLEKDRK
jgi:ribosome recycling factor